MSSRFAAAACAFALCSTRSSPAPADPEIPAPALADEAACPSTLVLETTNDNDYAISFDAQKPLTASFEVRLYGAQIDYTVSLLRVAVATPYQSEFGTQRFRSTGIDIQKADGPFPVAASITASTDAGISCPAEHVFIPRIKAVLAQKRTKTESALLDAIASEIGDGSRALPMIPQHPTKFPCATPFAPAALTHAVEPDFSDMTKLNHIGESPRILVTLDDANRFVSASVVTSSGNRLIDDTALKAARDSSYSSAIFACVPAAGVYSYRADFPEL